MKKLFEDEHYMIMLSGLFGLLAAILVGAGEFLLHFDPLARFSSDSYDFMLATSNPQQTLGHFLGVFASPLYLVGCWHLYLMLKPANKTLAFLGFLIGAYGFILGGDWISSRASIGALMHSTNMIDNMEELTQLYQLRYESLLTIIRITTLLMSVIFIYLTLTGKSRYQRWQAILNPILLLLSSFIIYLISPAIGKYMMPIALNIGFALFFSMSLIQAHNSNKQQCHFRSKQ
jgi:hypothetical protein